MNRLNDWEQKLHDSLADHATPPPADGWTRLERELAGRDAAMRRRRRIYRLGGLVAATGVAAAVLVALLLPTSPGSVESETAVVATAMPEKSGAAADEARQTPPRVQEVAKRPAAPLLAEARAETAETPQLLAAMADAGLETQSRPEANDEAAVAAVTEGVGGEETAGDAGEAAVTMKAAPAARMRARRAADQSVQMTAEKADKRGVSVALSVEGATAGQVSQSGYAYVPLVLADANSAESAATGEQFSSVLFQNFSQDVYSHIDHKLPLQVALGVSWPLTERLSLESGLTYTFLRSDLQSGSADSYYATRQRLHYVGIPLTLNYAFYQTAAVSLYASAGGSVAKCVSGDWRTDYVVAGMPTGTTSHTSVGRGLWQASAGLATGVEARLGKRWGLFLEPGVTYYFDDGSSLPTLRHDHPLNFSLQLGARWRLK